MKNTVQKYNTRYNIKIKYKHTIQKYNTKIKYKNTIQKYNIKVQ